MPAYNSSLANDAWPVTGSGAPVTPIVAWHLPTKFTDDSIISVPVSVHAPMEENDHHHHRAKDVDDDDDDEGPVKHERSNSSSSSSMASKLINKLKGGAANTSDGGKGGKREALVKILRMSRRDYLKYWARDNDGKYIGTEPEHLGPQLWQAELAKEPSKAQRLPSKFRLSHGHFNLPDFKEMLVGSGEGGGGGGGGDAGGGGG